MYCNLDYTSSLIINQTLLYNATNSDLCFGIHVQTEQVGGFRLAFNAFVCASVAAVSRILRVLHQANLEVVHGFSSVPSSGILK